MANLLFVFITPPYADELLEEKHDLVLASTAYGHNASVLFQSEGVQQLIKQQTPPEGRKNAAKRISGFEMFDVEPIYVCSDSLEQNNLSVNDLIANAELVEMERVKELLEQVDHVFRF